MTAAGGDGSAAPWELELGSGSRLRFRVYVDGELVEETWIDAGHPDAQEHIDAAQTSHVRWTSAAQAVGLLWMVEIYDPDLPDYHAYLRFGTDTRGMTRPTETVDLPGDAL